MNIEAIYTKILNMDTILLDIYVLYVGCRMEIVECIFSRNQKKGSIDGFWETRLKRDWVCL